jgi:hypothetical protein
MGADGSQSRGGGRIYSNELVSEPAAKQVERFPRGRDVRDHHCGNPECEACDAQQPETEAELLRRDLDFARAVIHRLEKDCYALQEALRGILEIGKRDMSNPKYDGYFEVAKKVIGEIRGL